MLGNLSGPKFKRSAPIPNISWEGAKADGSKASCWLKNRENPWSSVSVNSVTPRYTALRLKVIQSQEVRGTPFCCRKRFCEQQLPVGFIIPSARRHRDTERQTTAATKPAHSANPPMDWASSWFENTGDASKQSPHGLYSVHNKAAGNSLANQLGVKAYSDYQAPHRPA